MNGGRIESIRRENQTLYVSGNAKTGCFATDEKFLIKATFDPAAGIFLDVSVNGMDILSVFARGKENWNQQEEKLFDIFASFSEDLHAFYESGRKYAFLMYLP